MTTWIDSPELEVPGELKAIAGGNRLVAQALLRRGITDPRQAASYLDPGKYTPTPPEELPGLTEAIDLLEKAILKGVEILVWGDFDVDGQTATTLLVSALRAAGGKVTHYIPVRERESHGMHEASLKPLLKRGIGLVITCDTGISSHAAVDFASSQGVDTILTDHHSLPESLPLARAIVNPKLLADDTHPLYNLPGVGVAYKVAESLYNRKGLGGELEAMLDLVALGIVADVALLKGENRYLLQRGLQVLRRAERPGLRALFEQAELDASGITEDHIGFTIGPRLNALGRLSDANPIVEFLTTSEIGKARILAAEIEGLNIRRKLITEQIYRASLEQIQQDPTLLEPDALVLSHPKWPAGVIGIIASRLVEHYHKPVLLIATPPGEIGRGSARSIEGINITEAIASQARLLEGYGGHPMAAGFSLRPENIAQFRLGVGQAVHQQHKTQVVQDGLQIDGFIEIAELTLETVVDLARLAPFGAGNPPLVLVSRDLHITSSQAIGRAKEHSLVRVEDSGGYTQDVIWWQSSGLDLPEGRFDLAYSVHTQDYQGKPTLQVEWLDSRLLEPVEAGVQKPALQIFDYRDAPNPEALLKEIFQNGNCQVWGEGLCKPGIEASDRLHLTPSKCLVIWTSPPSREVLGAVLEKVHPDTVYLLANDPGLAEPEAFLKHLAGLLKYAMNQLEGRVEVARLACVTAHREMVVRAGLDFLQAKGLVTLTPQDEGVFTVSPGSGKLSGDASAIESRLKALLRETAAYRRYYLSADPATLL